MKIFLLLLFFTLYLTSISLGQNDRNVLTINCVDQDTTDKDTIGGDLLVRCVWETCAVIDSINQYYHIQFVSKDLLGNYNNCTQNSCGYSNWKFSRDNNEKILEISYYFGCPDDIISGGSLPSTWYWEYDNIGRVVKIFDKKGELRYSLLIKEISMYYLHIVTFKK